MLVGAIGNILMITTNNLRARMFAMYLLPIGVLPPFQIILAWITSTFARPLAKRSVTVAICGMFGNASSSYGSYLYPDSQAPRYVVAGVVSACTCHGCAIIAIIIRFVLKTENKKLDQEEERGGVTVRGFRYIL